MDVTKIEYIDSKQQLFDYDPCLGTRDRNKMFVLSGASGSGKTYSLLEFLPLFGKINAIAIYSKTVDSDDTYASIYKHYKEQGVPIKLELKLDTLLDTFEEYKHIAAPTIIIIDDFITSKSNRDVDKRLEELIATARHYGISLFFITSAYFNLSVPVRKNANQFVFWKQMKSKKIAQEDLSHIIDPNQFSSIINSLGTHQYLWINMDSKYQFRISPRDYYIPI